MTQAEKSTARIIRPEQDDLSEQAIVDYLQAKPDFFQGFPQLLESLHIPHENGPAISLVERQVNLLREKNTLLEEQLNLLISIARDNNETQQQIHQMVLEVLATQQAEPALQYLTSQLCKGFNVDQVAVRLLADESHPLTDIDNSWILTSQSARKTLDDFTPTSEPLCGRLKEGQLKRLFGEQADSVKSSVLIPLRKGLLHGVIALGSSDEHRFNPGMDTLYLKRMGELLSAALLRFIH
jgi:uncharacterized protein YigA (DUF484 family)